MEDPLKPKRRHLGRRRTLVGTILSLALAAFYFVASPGSAKHLQAITSPGGATVTRAVDGDTLDVSIDGHPEIVRLIGVDTPETHDPRKAVQCFGQAAAAHTKALAEGKPVRLEADPQDSNRDKYKRLLRYVYLPDGTLLNATLIKDGYAFAYTVFPFAKLEEFRGYEQLARSANRGLWGGCQVDSSSKIKQTQAQP